MTTPIPYTSITAAHWQPALGTPGEVVEGLRDIDQSIHIVLATPKGSDPHRPEFGSDLHLYIDWPLAQDWCHIRLDDTAQLLWRRELAPMGLRLFSQALAMLDAGIDCKGRPQDPDLATWEPGVSNGRLSG
ncbi:putative bacteriophage baseplate protein [Pseudomonas chlororaphis]|uniref:Putative bacteriophage baseplate protein n=1 Tax=Pseudomonas chlororaphis TaxID=587753 RepID=A0A3G7TT02_9PSED|nr:hypothetical protein [Pseudomonas chlororaphis]AZE49568.1 putative bacteriophage baseplate protein [Pseudomonas chlororaphis]